MARNLHILRPHDSPPWMQTSRTIFVWLRKEWRTETTVAL
uniref:Uncharacterized protein MANES_07G106500 n=1 Tax=Rhizophora mucronata TaxID=61149 RepID=A0A2P2KX19_RHIMU